METINNYKLKEFLKQDYQTQIEYYHILKNLEPIPTKNEIFYMSLKDVEEIKQLINSDDDADLIHIITKVQGVEESEVLDMKIVEVFGLINSIQEQIQRIYKAELSSLSSDNTNIKWEAVNGSERIQKFGIYNTLNTLSNGDILKWNAILELPYADVFMKLLLDKTNNDLQTEMQNLKLK